MAQITNYTTLKTEIGVELNRTDLTTAIPGFIQRAEARLNREKRARLLVDLSPLSVAQEEVAAPADMVAPDEIAHDGPSYFGELDLKGIGDMTRVKAIHGDTGVPIAYAVKSDGAGNLFFLFAPEPNATFALRASYYAGVTNGNSLSDTNLTNRMLLAHPDIYLYASLAETAGFLREDGESSCGRGFFSSASTHLKS